MNNGLTDNDIKIISSVLEKFEEVETAVIYGSRALGTFQKGSDIDITLKGQNLTNDICSEIHFILEEETLLPYFFDVANYQTITNINLKENIDRTGKIFYRKGWVKTTFATFAEINPYVKLLKGNTAKFVGMENVNPFTRKISGFKYKQYDGGMKFQNGDTLFARITPCLENGKTAFVDLLEVDESAFGSTEFIVIREKKEISYDKYLYYLAISPIFRETAIKSMNGTSGRQRVQTDLLKNKIFYLPTFAEQQSIANVLSSLDDKIELLQEENKTLEELAQTIFKEWFVNFNYPDKTGKPYKKSGGKMVQSELGEIPEGWSVGKYSSVAEVITGKGISAEKLKKDGAYEVYGANGVIGKTDEYLFDEEIIITGRVGTLGKIFLLYSKVWISDNVLISKPQRKEYYYFDYFLLKRINFHSLNVGSTQPLVTQTDLKNVVFVIPPIKILLKWDINITLLFSKISNNNAKISVLVQLRDNLLPKLMSGELRVK
ncbi:MAG: restriction endonuclease subunit S [bacterium]